MSVPLLRRLVRPGALAVVTAALALSLSACGASSSPSTAPSAAAPAQGGAGRMPGVSGLVAAVSGKTLQVQGTSEQTAVTYTAKTTFTELTVVKASALKTGLCATVRTGGDASPSATGTVVAGAVTLSTAVDGSCTGGFGGGARPGGAPSGAPSGGAGPGERMGTSGKVTSVDGSSFVVQSTRGGDASTVTVTTSAATTWEQNTKTTAEAVAVGKCVVAMGSTGATGDLTATSLRLSKAVDGSCASALSGGRRAGGTPTHG